MKKMHGEREDTHLEGTMLHSTYKRGWELFIYLINYLAKKSHSADGKHLCCCPWKAAASRNREYCALTAVYHTFWVVQGLKRIDHLTQNFCSTPWIQSWFTYHSIHSSLKSFNPLSHYFDCTVLKLCLSCNSKKKKKKKKKKKAGLNDPQPLWTVILWFYDAILVMEEPYGTVVKPLYCS